MTYCGPKELWGAELETTLGSSEVKCIEMSIQDAMVQVERWDLRVSKISIVEGPDRVTIQAYPDKAEDREPRLDENPAEDYPPVHVTKCPECAKLGPYEVPDGPIDRILKRKRQDVLPHRHDCPMGTVEEVMDT